MDWIKSIKAYIYWQVNNGLDLYWTFLSLRSKRLEIRWLKQIFGILVSMVGNFFNE